jgi:hypothetical protein
MLGGILRFEWRYQARRPAFAAVAAVFALVGFAFAATAFGPDDVHLNSPYSIAESLGLASLMVVLAGTFFCAQGALRDPEHRMTEIVFATAITKRQYVLGRYAGVVLATATAFAFVLPGLLAGTFAVSHDPARVAPFRLLPYVWACTILALPNLLLVTALLFGIALITRSALATYVGGILAYGVYFVAALFSGSPLMAGTSPPSVRGMAVAAVADPFGLSAFFEQTRYWTAAERDSELLVLGGHLLANRLLCLLAAALVVAAVIRRFAFRVSDGARGRSWMEDSTVEAPAGTVSRRVRPAAGARAALRAFASATAMELRHAARSWPLAGLLAGWVAIAAIELAQSFRRAEFGSALLPTTGLVLAQLRPTLSLFGLLLVVYYAAELVWRERTAGMEEIVDATPVGSGVLLLAKVAALATLVGGLVATAMASGVVYQLLSGWTRLDPALYASLLVFSGLPLLLVAVLAVLVQALVPNRYLGILAGTLVVAWWHLGALGGPDHPLLRFAGMPNVPWSDFAGFGPERLSFAWFGACWGAFAVVLLALAAGLWRRGTDTSLRRRLGALRRTRSAPARRVAAAGALLWIAIGALVFQQTNRWNAYRTGDEVEAWRAGYERAYRRFEALPQPTPVDVRLTVDLHPEERRYRVRGRYLLENRSAAPIGSLWVTVRRDLARAELRVEGRGPDVVDAPFGTYRFALSPPLPPGARTALDFDVAVRRRGALAGDPDYGIVRNGSFLLGTFSLPSIGYRRTYEIEDPDARRRQGLAPRSRPATLEGVEAAGLVGAGVPVTFDATLTTAADQIALAPGTLVASGERGGRRFFRYRTEGAIQPVVAFASGRYAVTRRSHRGVAVEVFHDAAQGRNVGAILDAAARTLDYCRARFGPYPHRELRIVEVPSFWRGFAGFAVPGTVFLVEDRGFLNDRSDPGRIDVLTKRVAHEVAHQWWGHQVSPAPLAGASALVESLARYTELRVLAATHGEPAVPRVLAFELDRYLAGRTDGDEAPLVAVEDQSYVYYAKGALVMTAVRDLIGEEATSRALSRLVAAARAGRQPVAEDLVAALEGEASAAERPLLDQWLRGIVLYDLRVAEATSSPLASGRVRLDLRLEATKSDWRDGRGASLPMDEELAVAVYADDPGVGGGGTPLDVRRFRIRGDGRVTMDVDAAARWVVVDPGLLRIDGNRADNLRPITAAATG